MARHATTVDETYHRSIPEGNFSLSDGLIMNYVACLPAQALMRARLALCSPLGEPGEMCWRRRTRECRCWRGEAKQDLRIVNGEGELHEARLAHQSATNAPARRAGCGGGGGGGAGR
jgi:hypothetical protein